MIDKSRGILQEKKVKLSQMDNQYGGVIWTNHALRRLEERGIKQCDAWATLSHPQESKFATTKRAWVFYRTYGDNRIEVVASQNKEKKWVILSVWSKTVFSKNYQTGQKPNLLENQVEKVLQKLLGRFRKTK